MKRGLEQESFAVDVDHDGQAGYGSASTMNYDLIVLDRMLPEMDGEEVCKKLREEKIHTPIIMLTAKSTVNDRVSGLNSGAANTYSTEITIFFLAAIRLYILTTSVMFDFALPTPKA